MTKELLLQSCLEGKTFINNQRYTEIFIELSLYLLQHTMEHHPYIFKIILIRSEQQRIITQIHSSVECAGWLVLILNRYITEVEAVRWRVLWRILKILLILHIKPYFLDTAWTTIMTIALALTLTAVPACGHSNSQNDLALFQLPTEKPAKRERKNEKKKWEQQNTPAIVGYRMKDIRNMKQNKQSCLFINGLLIRYIQLALYIWFI